ncbi:Gibberellin 3-beta-dioxygenase 1 [Striga hermonthica]|uniref:gibberellin 3beta-dioxygenase n=1 Tax=Striga hermonthica TaxID=68872 RepID=A0A9N7RS04_STRHE|nr:Gibberellin 3-beta-dioxygenase 1 [Striga hermonthica]
MLILVYNNPNCWLARGVLEGGYDVFAPRARGSVRTIARELNAGHLNSMKELPDSHAWTTTSQGHNDDDPSFTYESPENIPVVDLNDDDVIGLVGHACTAWGIFQVLNHGVPQELLEEIESAAGRLFSLPMHHKLRAARQPDGISGYGSARISSFFSKHMWSEGFTVAGSPLDHARTLWPHDYHKFCDTIEEYRKAMNELAVRLMRLVLGSLGIADTEADGIKWATTGEARSAALQLNSYPACPDPGRAMGLAAHTDSTVLTILHQSNTSGLQVRREDPERWVTVPPLGGALVVHVGDLLQIMSNGKYPSVVHRAVVNRARHRLSVAYLYGPPTGVKVGPLRELVDECCPALYRAVTWSEYLGKKATYFDKALTSVRVCGASTAGGLVDGNDQLVA